MIDLKSVYDMGLRFGILFQIFSSSLHTISTAKFQRRAAEDAEATYVWLKSLIKQALLMAALREENRP